MDSTKRNVALLASCQAMLFANNSTLFAINALTGFALAPIPALATLPMTCWVLGGAAATMPASFHMKRVGRQRGLTVGTLWGVVGGIGCATAVWLQSFWLLCLATLVFGVFNAYGQYYRFAAADTATPDYRPTAISLVLAGGLVGGILGPASSRLTVDLLQPKFLAAYIGILVFVLAGTVLLQFIRIPNPTPQERAASGRPLLEIAAQPKFMVAVLCAAIGYGVMNFLMTSTPIAMHVCGLAYGDTALVISSHIVGMFAPSFFTGHLMRRFGVLKIMMVGALLNFGTVAIALAGITVAHFWWALVILGIGWNFLYIGGTTLLTETYRPEERAKAQGAMDQCIFIVMAISSFSSGMTVTSVGWARVNLLALPLIAIIAVALTWFAIYRRTRPAAA